MADRPDHDLADRLRHMALIGASSEMGDGYLTDEEVADLRAAAARLRQLSDRRTQLTGDTSVDIAITYGYEVGVEDGRAEGVAERDELRRELDARTDQPTADELQAALSVQFDAPVPCPGHWRPIQQAAYRDGWLDAMQRVKDSTDTAAAARLLGGGE